MVRLRRFGMVPRRSAPDPLGDKMKHLLPVSLVIVASLLGTPAGLAAADLLDTWSKGDPLPGYLLGLDRERDAEDDLCVELSHKPTCFVPQISNYQLLLAIVCDERTQDDVRLLATEQALVTTGPTQFYADLRSRAVDVTSPATRRRLARLLRRSALPHALVDVLSISEADFSASEAQQLRAIVAARMAEGQTWKRVLTDLSDQYRLPGCCRTKVRNIGAFAIDAEKHDAEPLRSVRLPRAHIKPLLASSASSILLLETAEGSEHDRWYVYSVRERYRPAAR